jgi:hypothetical protein
MLVLLSIVAGTTPWAVMTGADVHFPRPAPPPPPPSFHSLVHTVAARVQKLRGERFDRIPKVELVQPEEMSERLTDSPSADHAQPAAKSVAVRSLVALDGTQPPHRKGVGLPLGAYVPSDHTVYILKEDIAYPMEPVIAHELTHALEDQRFGLDEPAKIGGSEAAEAVRALDEGSASFVEGLYVHRYMDGAPSGVEMYSSLYRGHTKNPRMRVAIARHVLPYLAGKQFVARLYRRGGWDLVNRAFAHPPAVTSAIAHPQRWLRGAPYTIPAVSPPGPPSVWRFLGTGHFGEIETNVLLHASLDTRAARRGAAGIDGGRYAVWRRRSAPYGCGIPCPSDTVATIAWRFVSWRQARQFERLAPNLLAEVDGQYLGNYVWSTRFGYAGIAGTGGPNAQGDPTWVISFAPSKQLARRMALRGSGVAATAARQIVPPSHD